MTENHSNLKAVRSHESNTSCYIQPGWICAETCTTQEHGGAGVQGVGETKSPERNFYQKYNQRGEERETTALAFEYKASYISSSPIFYYFFHMKISVF